MFKALKNLFGGNKAKNVNRVRPKLEGLETRETPSGFLSTPMPQLRYDGSNALVFGQTYQSSGVRIAGSNNGVLNYEREQPVRPYNQFQSAEWNYRNRLEAVQSAQPVANQTVNAVSAAQARMNALLRHSGRIR